MSSSRSTRLRRSVGVAGVVVACAAGVAAAFVLLDEGGQQEARETVSVPRPTPRPPHPGEGVAPSPREPTVDELLAELEPASAGFSSPTSMHLGDATEVELLVSRELAVDELQEKLQQVGELAGETIRVSETMEAQLTGVGFAIEQITPAVQLVPGEGATQWKWAVEATDSGRQRLHLTLSAIVDRNGRDRQYTIRTFARTLDVEVTLQDRLSGFVSGNWQWLWATLLVPLVGWAVQQRRHRRGRQTPPSALQP